jgi:hypothetical protein
MYDVSDRDTLAAAEYAPGKSRGDIERLVVAWRGELPQVLHLR